MAAGVTRTVSDGTCVVDGTHSACVSFLTGGCDIKVSLECTKITTPGSATQMGNCRIASASDVKCPKDRVVDTQFIQAFRTKCDMNDLTKAYDTSFDKVCVVANNLNTNHYTPVNMGNLNTVVT